MSQPASTLSDLSPFERSLIRVFRTLRAARPSSQAMLATLVTFALNVVAMAATSVSSMDSASVLVMSALQAAVVTAICIAPGVLAYVFGVTRRVHHWAMLAPMFLALGRLASR